MPIGACNPQYRATLLLPAVRGRHGATQILEPTPSGDERDALRRSGEVIKDAYEKAKR